MSWRDEPITKGELVDALGRVTEKLELGFGAVLNSILTGGRQGLPHQIVSLMASTVTSVTKDLAKEIEQGP